jgi:hypothetical protein
VMWVCSGLLWRSGGGDVFCFTSTGKYRFQSNPGGTGRASRQYDSSAVKQLMTRMLAQDEVWHSSDRFFRPEHLRLCHQLKDHTHQV